MKIKFPFFSKKFPWVCTTEQVVHQIDGKDKKLSEILSGGPCVTINGKDPLDYGEYSASMLEIAAKTVAAFSDIGMAHLYIFSPIDVVFDLTSPKGGDIYFITKDFECFTTFSMEIDAETAQKVTPIGEVGINPDSPERYIPLIDGRGSIIQETFMTVSVDAFEDVIACFIDDYNFE